LQKVCPELLLSERGLEPAVLVGSSLQKKAAVQEVFDRPSKTGRKTGLRKKRLDRLFLLRLEDTEGAGIGVPKDKTSVVQGRSDVVPGGNEPFLAAWGLWRFRSTRRENVERRLLKDMKLASEP
jgi:hypothetical protein